MIRPVFEFDPDKSAANRAKHGIDFETAQALWRDDRRRTIASLYDGEERWVVVGKFDGRIWAAAITWRGDLIRIISVRRARAKEEQDYNAQED